MGLTYHFSCWVSFHMRLTYNFLIKREKAIMKSLNFSQYLIASLGIIILLIGQSCSEMKSKAIAPSNLKSSPETIASDLVLDGAKLVDIKSINPNIVSDIRYATTNNFLEQKLYPVAKCALRKEVAEKLSKVQKDLEEIGLGLKVFDCYRPLSVTKKMWEVLPDSRYVANPAKGSRHNRGAAVDVSLVDLKTGIELEMPTAYDDFSQKAWRNYDGNELQVQKNSDLLASMMKKNGFEPLITEWWHFDFEGWEKFSILDVSLDEIP